MQLLLDSHALIWFLRGDFELSAPARQAMTDTGNHKIVSLASIWEIAIKVNLGKIHFDFPFSDFYDLLAKNNFALVSFNFGHVLKVSALQHFHRDPFDRMLIAQALTENLTVVTKDPNFPLYGVSTIW